MARCLGDRRLVGVILGVVLLAAAGRASAHHSFSAEFDANQAVTLTGTVTSVEWRSPHVWFYVDVKDDERDRI